MWIIIRATDGLKWAENIIDLIHSVQFLFQTRIEAAFLTRWTERNESFARSADERLEMKYKFVFSINKWKTRVTASQCC